MGPAPTTTTSTVPDLPDPAPDVPVEVAVSAVPAVTAASAVVGLLDVPVMTASEQIAPTHVGQRLLVNACWQR